MAAMLAHPRLAVREVWCGVARRATVAFAALAAANTLLAATGHDRPRWLTKQLLMPVLMAGRDRPAQRALALGGAGDVVLFGRGEAAFTAGLVSFLPAHEGLVMATYANAQALLAG
jgi:hypothetical protein